MSLVVKRDNTCGDMWAFTSRIRKGCFYCRPSSDSPRCPVSMNTVTKKKKMELKAKWKFSPNIKIPKFNKIPRMWFCRRRNGKNIWRTYSTFFGFYEWSCWNAFYWYMVYEKTVFVWRKIFADRASIRAWCGENFYEYFDDLLLKWKFLPKLKIRFGLVSEDLIIFLVRVETEIDNYMVGIT